MYTVLIFATRRVCGVRSGAVGNRISIVFRIFLRGWVKEQSVRHVV
jgi:hypothetical protein